MIFFFCLLIKKVYLFACE